jgi:hypothetical protein
MESKKLKKRGKQIHRTEGKQNKVSDKKVSKV